MRTVTALFFLFCLLVSSSLAQLRLEFYSLSCPLAELIVNQVVTNHIIRDNNKNITAALLRMQFSDCFVNGCDASILIDSIDRRPSEKSAGQNANMRGFEIIDAIKRELELRCPQTVSCADIIALATRDAVVIAGGPSFLVRTGRRDGLKSDPKDVNLPGPAVSVAASIELFKDNGLDTTDMVALIGGGHSVGVAHCSVFKDRLDDPTMTRSLSASLKRKCSAPNDPNVFLDQRTPYIIDNAIFKAIETQGGILKIDQNLGLDKSTSATVSNFASRGFLFQQKFAQAMVKMGTIGVITGEFGEIRRDCRVFND